MGLLWGQTKNEESHTCILRSLEEIQEIRATDKYDSMSLRISDYYYFNYGANCLLGVIWPSFTDAPRNMLICIIWPCKIEEAYHSVFFQAAFFFLRGWWLWKWCIQAVFPADPQQPHISYCIDLHIIFAKIIFTNWMWTHVTQERELN